MEENRVITCSISSFWNELFSPRTYNESIKKTNKESVLLSWFYRSVRMLLSSYNSTMDKDHAKQSEKEQIKRKVCKPTNNNNLQRNQTNSQAE